LGFCRCRLCLSAVLLALAHLLNACLQFLPPAVCLPAAVLPLLYLPGFCRSLLPHRCHLPAPYAAALAFLRLPAWCTCRLPALPACLVSASVCVPLDFATCLLLVLPDHCLSRSPFCLPPWILDACRTCLRLLDLTEPAVLVSATVSACVSPHLHPFAACCRFLPCLLPFCCTAGLLPFMPAVYRGICADRHLTGAAAVAACVAAARCRLRVLGAGFITWIGFVPAWILLEPAGYRSPFSACTVHLPACLPYLLWILRILCRST